MTDMTPAKPVPELTMEDRHIKRLEAIATDAAMVAETFVEVRATHLNSALATITTLRAQLEEAQRERDDVKRSCAKAILNTSEMHARFIAAEARAQTAEKALQQIVIEYQTHGAAGVDVMALHAIATLQEPRA